MIGYHFRALSFMWIVYAVGGRSLTKLLKTLAMPKLVFKKSYHKDRPPFKTISVQILIRAFT